MYYVLLPRLCVFAYEYFVFLGRFTNPSAKPPFLEDMTYIEAAEMRFLRNVNGLHEAG